MELPVYILFKRINKWSDEHDKINDNQFGLQKSKSTVDCIFVLSAIISKVINGNAGNKNCSALSLIMKRQSIRLIDIGCGIN